MKKNEIPGLSIEITRKCNMKCSHCMRGSSRNVNIKPEYITNVLRHARRIRYLNITGGEPSMNVDAIKFILTQLKRRKITVDRFQIITNGSETAVSEEFIGICSKLYAYQQEKPDKDQNQAMLEMSNDKYHDEQLQTKAFEKLSKYPFFSNRYTTTTNGVPLIKQGRSKTGYELWENTISLFSDEVEGYIYLNALGYIISASDFSYRNQDKHRICHSNKLMDYLKSKQTKSLYSR
ncbi:radical SAM protein [Dysgonomonas sp. ZJ709]|uniref:radical SAM protein n=1 Tax=Dysgonomonas sp. ZJ709 TaxID=2709797 RepID=UPI0013ECBF7D|nr:radical SAM protein [Dysgonomonas sp. ZJ709]